MSDTYIINMLLKHKQNNLTLSSNYLNMQQSYNKKLLLQKNIIHQRFYLIFFSFIILEMYKKDKKELFEIS